MFGILRVGTIGLTMSGRTLAAVSTAFVAGACSALGARAAVMRSKDPKAVMATLEKFRQEVRSEIGGLVAATTQAAAANAAKAVVATQSPQNPSPIVQP